MKIDPPRIPRKILHWFCDPDLLEDVEGDLNELFETRASKNIRQAKWLYTFEVLKLFRPGIIKNFQPANSTNMFGNHITTALRQASKHKGYTAINITGLVVGLASCMLIMLWVSDEVTKDQFHEKADRIYQVWRNMEQSNGSITTTSGIPFPLEHVLKTQYAEIEAASSISWEQEYMFRVDEISSYEKGRYVTPGFFDVFSFPLIVGDQNAALENNTGVIISDRMALKLFGSEWKQKAVGQLIKVDERVDLTVTGVFAVPGENSTLRFDWLAPAQPFIDRNHWVNSWFNGGFRMYLALKPGSDIEGIREQVAQEVIKNTNNQSKEPLYLQLFSENYLNGSFENGIPVGGRIQYVRILSAIAILLLVVACINFMNLSTARASIRAREIGVRKVMGAVRSTLTQQFFIESLLYAFISGTLALLVVYVSLPYFNVLTQKNLFIDFTSPAVWMVLVSIIMLSAVLSGAYPAFMLSAFPVSKSLKGRTKQSSGSYFRHSLVIFQFATSIFLISGTIVVSRQLDYIFHKDIGVERENLVMIEMTGDLLDKRDVFLNSLRSVPEVKGVTMSTSDPTNFGTSTGGAKWPGKDPNSMIEINVLTVGDDFVKTMGIDMLRGEDFKNEFLYDSSRFLINDVLAKIIGAKDPVGQELSVWGTTGTVAGVVKDFHMESMYEPIMPVIIRYDPKDVGITFIRINSETQVALAGIERVTKDLSPAYPFRYQFVDERFGKRYQAEISVGVLVKIFAGVSIFIACMGLFGLSSFAAGQRAREIGIRKVHGASTRSLVVLLSKQYATMMIVAFLIGAPLAYFYMQKWLSDFVYRTDAGIYLFILAGVATFLVGALTVSYKSYTAALANPVKTLKED